MIKLTDGLITDILPAYFKDDMETRAFAYALHRQMERLCAYADGIMIYSAIAAMPERILDILAVELRTPAYNEEFSLDTKRALVEGTLQFYFHMGTPYALEKLIEIIFGEGYISEWFEYDGDPHYFKAYTTNPNITEDDVDEFKATLSTVKRLSSWIDEIVLELSTGPFAVYQGFWLHTGEFIRLQDMTL